MITTESKKMGNLSVYLSEKKEQYVMNRPLDKLKFAFKTFALLIITFALLGSVSAAGAAPEEFIILSTYNGTSIMLSFNEEGIFDLPDPVYPGSSLQCYGVGMADFDGDGDFDFVLGKRFNGSIYYYEKTGPGNSFAEPVIVGAYSGYQLDFAVEDYNRDGNYDFIFTNFGGTAYLFEGRGDGTFTSRTFRIPANCIAADSGDFNNDGIPDFALQSFGSGDAVFFIYLGNGDGTFTASAFTGVFTTRSWGLTAGDFDGNGNIDILAGGGYYGTSFYLYPGNGDGTFESGSHVMSLGSADNSPADNYDFNHDGFMDFACLKANERAVYVFFGDGTGSFMPAPENPIRVQTNAILFGIATPPHQNGWNQPPEVGAISAPVDPVQVNAMVEVHATFSDPDILDTHTAEWDWGDDSTSAGTVDPGTVTGSHPYTTPGVYTVMLTVTDGEASDEAVFQYIVVYDPSAGFVTGGGWIASPPGAYTADPFLTGKANFGFVAKYKKGATVPTGNTEFQFKAGDLNFHSSSYDWLLVNQGGTNAQFKGSGTINGGMDPNGEYYRFMLWAGDGEPDTFRIRIWEEDEGGVETVKYDNGFNQEIGGGSIVVHAK